MNGKLLALPLLGLGVFLLLQVSLPLLSFKIWELKFIQSNNLLISPQPPKKHVLGVSIQKQDGSFPAFISSLQRDIKAPFDEFTMSVPRLEIKQAKVLVDSNDLTAGLAHLPGSALPGERGNVFISGHSSLPQFFKGDKNYGAIFANLANLKKGDQILIQVGGSEFNYQVLGIKIVEPNDLSVILPPDETGRFLSLMTCVPPGLNTKRLVVLAKLI
ncbi:class E sortase [Candidatus Daviesbacteria bacterium]|nr:class E sortase [Candidatus Daviesbacteria bacterium]